MPGLLPACRRLVRMLVRLFNSKVGWRQTARSRSREVADEEAPSAHGFAVTQQHRRLPQLLALLARVPHASVSPDRQPHVHDPFRGHVGLIVLRSRTHFAVAFMSGAWSRR